MSVLRICKLGDEVLGRKTDPVTAFDDELARLVGDMEETMHAAHGVGLAANQVGLSLALAIIDVAPGTADSKLWVLANPEIVDAEGEQREEEGCLSVPGLSSPVDRPTRVVARYQDLHGEPREVEGTGLLARALCHEIDHLNGFLFIQRIPGLRGDMARRKARRMSRDGSWDDVHP